MKLLKSVWQYIEGGSWRGLLFGLGCGCLGWMTMQVQVLHGLDTWMFDGCFATRGSRPTKTKIVLVALDDASLDELKKPLIYISPELAEVVSYLDRQGTAAIGLDMIIPESLFALPELQTNGIGDATTLGRAIAASGKVVLAEWRLDGHWLRPLPQWRLKGLQDDVTEDDLAFVDTTEDEDGFLRRQQLYLRTGEAAQPHFALALLAQARRVLVEWKSDSLWIGDEQIPLDSEQLLPINFVGPAGSFTTLSFRDVLAAARQHRPTRMDLKDAIVVVGVTAQSQQDFHLTPYANAFFQRKLTTSRGLMSGSELHGHIVATIADRAFVRSLPQWLSLILLLLAGGLLGATFARLSLPWGATLALVFHFAWKALCVAVFDFANLRLMIVPMLLVGILTFATTFVVRWLRLQKMLGVVKSVAIARAMEADPHSLDLKGSERIVTVLFADIRDFTTFSESHSPRHVVALLNEYFSAIVPLIEKHGGVLNQYMGDGVMVMFGAPLTCEEHALQALQAAIAVVSEVHRMRDRWIALDFPELRIGVGVHTGRVIVGNIGSPKRLDYTAIGDVVNSAARIEAENKRLGTEILISSETFQSIPIAKRSFLGCAELPTPAIVKGRSQTLYLHEVRITT